MSPRASAAPRRFDLATHLRGVEAFLGEAGAERFRHPAGLSHRRGDPGIHPRHAALFSREAIDGLRAAVAAGGHDAAQHRALLAFSTDGHLRARLAPLDDAVGAAEATAVIVWRGEELPYHAVPARVAETSGRTERNALFRSFLDAVEAINPLREQRFEQVGAIARELGYADYLELVAVTRGYDPDALGAQLRGFLTDSETPYFAALRRYLARIEIEQGDASAADLLHLLRGSGWDHWFDPRRATAVLEATLRGMGIDLHRQPGAAHDTESLPQPGWQGFGARLHDAGHVAHFQHVDPDLPVAARAAGDASVSEGHAMAFERLLAAPGWLSEAIGMPIEHAESFADFGALQRLASLRQLAGHHLYELGLHRGGGAALHRASYAGLVGLLTGIQVPEEQYLGAYDGMVAADLLRASMLEAALTEALAARHGAAWWGSPDAGETLRQVWSHAPAGSAERVVAHLGYDSLDWRPVIRQTRATLIGEMSGYGGPNITTRAGTRKV